MKIISLIINRGVLIQEVNVFNIQGSSIEKLESVYTTIPYLEEVFVDLSERFETKYILIPNDNDIQKQMVEKHNFIIFNIEEHE